MSVWLARASEVPFWWGACLGVSTTPHSPELQQAVSRGRASFRGDAAECLEELVRDGTRAERDKVRRAHTPEAVPAPPGLAYLDFHSGTGL